MKIKNQSGSAIVMALFVVACVAILVTGIAGILQHFIHNRLSLREQTRVSTALNEPIPFVYQKLAGRSPGLLRLVMTRQYDGITVMTDVIHAQTLLNANAFALLSPAAKVAAMKSLQAFFKEIGLDGDLGQLAANFLSALNHKLVITGEPINSYQWPGRPFLLPSELRSIPGMTPHNLAILNQWMTVLPPGTGLIPTPSRPAILVALGFSPDQAKQVSSCLADSQGLTSPPAALAACQLPQDLIVLARTKHLQLTSANGYYLIRSTAWSHHRQWQRSTLVSRKQHGRQTTWRILWQRDTTH